MLWLKCKMPFRKHLTLVKIKKNFSEYVEKRVFPENEYKKYIEPKPFTFIPAFPPILTPTVNQKISLWTKNKIRTGLIAVKTGKISIWDNLGVFHACTVIDNLQVIKIQPHLDKNGNARMLLGCGQKNWNRVISSQKTLFEKAGVPYKAHVREFKVSQDAVLPIGTAITARHFVPGQLVDAKAITFGKGFQGTIKRHNFKRQPKSHGATKVHRKPGSQGNKGAARVFPGKKGAGRMGGKFATILNLKVMRIDVSQNTIFVKGDIPGKPGTFVYLRDAMFKPPVKFNVPYPTYIPDPYEKIGDQVELNAVNDSPTEVFTENMDVDKIE